MLHRVRRLEWRRPVHARAPLYHRALYFATILLYYTGARREEICGLMVDDVQSPDSWWAIKGDACRALHPRERSAPPQERPVDAACRAVPEVVRLGFLDYVREICALGYKLVFPDLKSPTSRSPMGDRLYDELKLIFDS